MVLDPTLKVVKANHSFYQTFHVKREKTEGETALKRVGFTIEQPNRKIEAWKSLPAIGSGEDGDTSSW